MLNSNPDAMPAISAKKRSSLHALKDAIGILKTFSRAEARKAKPAFASDAPEVGGKRVAHGLKPPYLEPAERHPDLEYCGRASYIPLRRLSRLRPGQFMLR